jgi:hypothetical protein
MPSLTESIVNKMIPLVGDAEVVRPFMSRRQFNQLVQGLSGPQGQTFADVFTRLKKTIEAMPKTYDTDGQGDEAIVHLHYYHGADSDWFITEKDVEDGVSQATSFGILNGDLQNAELGYVCITELVDAHVELDLRWEPKTLREIKARKGIR